jgi:hypothetical protein
MPVRILLLKLQKNHGTNEVAAKRRDRMEVCAPSATKDGYTLFLFLR